MEEFLTSNEWQWRLVRTIVQGVIGVVVANLDLIVGLRYGPERARARRGAGDGGAVADHGGDGRRGGVRDSEGRWQPMTPQERVVARARAEVGYVPSHGEFNKYALALDATGIYNYPKNGYGWCDIFYDLLLVSEFGLDVAKAMTSQPSGGCGAGCEWSASYYRAANQWSEESSLGAQIFFGSRGSESHTGIVVGYDSAHVYGRMIVAYEQNGRDRAEMATAL